MANYGESVKVVLIDTQYVKTDATSFKSVVQSLTGKDSSVEWIDQKGTFNNNDNYTKRKRSPVNSTTVKSDVGKAEINESSMLSRGLSFKDFDRMLMEMPPLDDVQCWLSNDFMVEY